MVVPDMFRNHRPREDFFRVSHEIFQKGIFFACQFDFFPLPHHFVSDEGEGQIGDLATQTLFPFCHGGAGREFLREIQQRQRVSSGNHHILHPNPFTVSSMVSLAVRTRMGTLFFRSPGSFFRTSNPSILGIIRSRTMRSYSLISAI